MSLHPESSIDRPKNWEEYLRCRSVDAIIISDVTKPVYGKVVILELALKVLKKVEEQ